jgi:hypothetical protein
MSTRRHLLALTVGAIAARTLLPIAARAELVHGLPEVTSEGHPDAALITACAAAEAAWDEIEAMPRGQEDEVWEALSRRWNDAIAAVTNMRARTGAGCKAKARILLLDMEDQEPGEIDRSGRLAWALARDVLLGSMA